MATIKGSRRRSLVVTAMHYLRRPDGGVVNTYPIPGKLAIGDELHTTYNLHLEQRGSLWVANATGRTQTALLTMVRQDGTIVADEIRVQVPPHGLTTIDLADYEEANQHGAVSLEMLERSTLVAGVLRERFGEFVISTVAEPRFK